MKLKTLFVCLLAFSMLLATLSGCKSEQPPVVQETQTQQVTNDDPDNPNLAPIDGEENKFNI